MAAEFFSGRQMDIGEFGFQFGGTTSHHRIITHRMPST
jgi:hypothetical protein